MTIQLVEREAHRVERTRSKDKRQKERLEARAFKVGQTGGAAALHACRGAAFEAGQMRTGEGCRMHGIQIH